MTIEEVKAFLATDEGKQLVTELVQANTNVETLKGLVTSNEEIKKWFGSEVDRNVTKGIESFKVKTLPTLVEAEVAKLNPQETEEQKQLRLLKAEFEQTKREAQKEKLLNKAMSYANEKGIPVKFLDRFIGDSEESTLANLDEYGTFFNESVQNAVQGKFKDNGRTVVTDKDKKMENNYNDWLTKPITELR